jgi:GntR family transcriptional regulator, carbon starvation induced regulator
MSPTRKTDPLSASGSDSAAADAGDGGSSTLSQMAAERVRTAILSGAIAPGTKLHILRLSEQFGLSATPMREGLTRLASTGLVEAVGQRGFRVQPISLQDLEDIQRMRHLVEVEALRLAIAHGDMAWEQGIVAALHGLKSLGIGSHETLPEGEPVFDRAHRDFHSALLAGCGSPRLLQAHAELHDQVYRYRIVLRLVPRRKAVTDRDHAALARHALARDTQAACDALHAHIDMTTQALKLLPPATLKQVFGSPA